MCRRRTACFDAAVIAAVTTLSLARYASSLGFYSDDWAFLGMYATSADQSLWGLYDAAYSSHHAMRPVQLWLCAALYRIFGMNPAGFHLVNAVLVVLNPLLLYAVAHAMRVPRVMALAVALAYGLLPNYSTDRFWYVAFAITFSITAALTSVYAQIKAVASPALAGVAWTLVAVLALLGSVLAYEVPMPLLLVAAPALILWRLSQDRGTLTRARIACAVVLIAINIALLAGVAAIKLRSTVRLGAQQGLAAQVGDIVNRATRLDWPRGEYGLNIANALRVHFVEYGIQLPANAFSLGRTAPRGVLALTFVAALAVFLYLTFALPGDRWPSLRAWSLLAGTGIVVFALGYAIFLTNYNVQFTPTGIANRTAIAATLGAAMCLVGAIGAPLTLVPSSRLRGVLFAGAITIVTSSGFLIINVLAQQWIAAYAAERNILTSLRARFPTLAPGSTLLLGGICPYIGPAIVFEAEWDLTGALHVYYRDRTLRANVVTSQTTAEEDAMALRLYEHTTRYPYSPSLLGYNPVSGEAQRLADAATAKAWLSRSRATTTCPAGREGTGVEPF